MTTAAWGYGLTTYAADDSVLDTWFPEPALGEKPADATPPADLTALEGTDTVRRVERQHDVAGNTGFVKVRSKGGRARLARPGDRRR